MLFMQVDQDAVVRKEIRDGNKNRDGALQSDHSQKL
jgi:hypothetical protein